MNRALSALLCFVAVSATAEPRFDAAIDVAGETLYPDHRLEHVFYRRPRPVRLAHHESGRPDIDLTLTYYVGTAHRGDSGTHDVRWALRVGVERPAHVGSEDALRRALMSRTRAGRGVVVRPLSILAIPASVEYARIDSAETPGEPIRLDESHVDASADGAGAQWSRRSLSFALERHDGTVLREAMASGGAVMSLSFAYRVSGVEWDTSRSEPAFRRVERFIEADALRVTVDTDAYPEFLRIVDLNATAPPGYPGLTVICSDFVADASAWTYEEKEIELEAVGVTGKPIRTRVVFPGDDPMASLARVAFPYAVRVDQPYRFRIRSYWMNGDETQSDWVEQSIWAAPLDVTAELEENGSSR